VGQQCNRSTPEQALAEKNYGLFRFDYHGGTDRQ
jgi:hypothetical protein